MNKQKASAISAWTIIIMILAFVILTCSCITCKKENNQRLKYVNYTLAVSFVNGDRDTLVYNLPEGSKLSVERGTGVYYLQSHYGDDYQELRPGVVNFRVLKVK